MDGIAESVEFTNSKNVNCFLYQLNPKAQPEKLLPWFKKLNTLRTIFSVPKQGALILLLMKITKVGKGALTVQPFRNFIILIAMKDQIGHDQDGLELKPDLSHDNRHVDHWMQ